MAQGYTQEEEIDYEEVFALVARNEAIRLLLAYALFMGFIVYQMDVKSAFLYSTIVEEIYVMQPPRFQDLEFPERVYKVEKAMGTIDQTLFIRKHKREFLLVLVYVDDIIFGSSNPQLCKKFEALILDKFQMSAMDSDYGGATQDRRSTTGGCQFLERRLILWQRKKQTIMATSRTEAKYVAVDKFFGYKARCWIMDEPASLSRDDRHEEAFPTVSSLVAGMQQRLHELMELCTSLQRKQSQMAGKIKDQDIEISRLKARVKPLEDKERRRADKSTENGRNDTEEMVNMLSSIEAANILSSGGAAFSTASVSPVDVFLTAGVPTVSVIFTTASVITPYTRRSRGITIGSLQHMRIPIISAKDKGKEKVTETKVPKKKKLQEQIDAQVAREMEEEFSRENQRLSEQAERDFKIARIHAEEELNLMIEGLDRSNEVIAKHLMEESEKEKRPGIKLDQGSSKRVKISHTSRSKTSQEQQFKDSKGVSEEELKGMMQLVPLEEVYIEALQVKHPIIDWEIHSEGKREYWKIIILGGHTGAYQFFVDMLNQFDREDLHQLWILVKETFSMKQSTRDKEKEIWVELKRLFEPDFED
nr:copia protein [Tanacetum cinerariifolium]